jgi:hypothetical protein
MSQGSRAVVSTQIIDGAPDLGEFGFLYTVVLFFHIKMPENARVKVWIRPHERKDVGYSDVAYSDATPHQYTAWSWVFGPGAVEGSNQGVFTTTSQADNYLIGVWGDMTYKYWLRWGKKEGRHFRNHWAPFTSEYTLNVAIERTDDEPGDVILYGVYAIPVAGIHKGSFPDDEENRLSMKFGYLGKGWPSGGKSHPSHITASLLEDEGGVHPDFIGFTPTSHFPGIRGWQMGFSLDEATEIESLLAEIQEQSTTMLVKDSDTYYRLRLMARYGGLPTSQRYGHALVYGRDIQKMRVNRPGKDFVKNHIIVDYLPDQAGKYLRSTFVRHDDSDDGYGMRQPGAEELALASYTQYSKVAKMHIKARLIRHRGTAVDLCHFLLMRYAFIPWLLQFQMGHLGDVLHTGSIITFDPTSMDAWALLGGESWYGKYFQVERKSRRGDTYTFLAMQAPAQTITDKGMVPRYKMRGARP